LTVAALLAILLATFHLSDDVLYHGGMSATEFFAAVLILVIWLCGATVLAGRQAGYVMVLLGSLVGLVVPIVHIAGAGGHINGGIEKSGDAYFFVWTLMTLAVTSLFSIVLSVLGLWRGSSSAR
jgi:hypothetical protein